MKILWIPHQTWLNRHGITRDKHLIENLKNNHEIHVIQHTQPYQNDIISFLKPKFLSNSIRKWTICKNGIYHHHIRHIYFTRFKPIQRLNNKIFRKTVKNIIKEYSIDLVITGPSHYLHGFPPFGLSIPLIFDYVDFLHDFKNPNKENTPILRKYLENSSKILCVSKTLIETLPNKFQDKALYLPNGVDLNFYKSFDFKKKYNKNLYISLIGLSISESFFYIDIFPEITKNYNNAKLLLVGGGPRLPSIRNYIKKNKDLSNFILTGYIPYQKIRKCFYMTDVGLYPTLKNRYYDSACPLKVFEYTATRRPVVATNLKELEKLDFPNVFLAKPNPNEFRKQVEKAMNYNGPYPDLSEYDWKNLANKLEENLKKL